MDASLIALISMSAVITVDLVALAGLVALKGVRRRRAERHRARRAAYTALLSRHVATATPQRIAATAPRDDAFLDALIDLRSVVSGQEVERLAGLVDTLGLARQQEARLRGRFPLGRRLRAAVSLAEIGDESTAATLVEHLSDREREIRIQCARGLGRMRHLPAIDRILERLALEEPWVRARFSDTLVGFGRAATEPLLAYVWANLGRHGHQGVVAAIRAIGSIGDHEAGPALAGMLGRSADPEVEIALIETLGSVGGPLAIRPLELAFRSADWTFRAKAATSLGRIGDPSVNATVAEGLKDANWWVRRNSAAALGTLPGGPERLLGAMHSDDPHARDAAAEALADIGVLAAARERAYAGRATESDRLLLGHVEAATGVPA